MLTFYQERIANEGFLAPPPSARSVLELARSHRLRAAPRRGRHHLARVHGRCRARRARRVPDPGRHQRPERARARRAAAGVRDGRGARRPPGAGTRSRLAAPSSRGSRPRRHAVRLAGTDSCSSPATRCSCSAAAAAVVRRAPGRRRRAWSQAVLAAPTDPVPLVPGAHRRGARRAAAARATGPTRDAGRPVQRRSRCTCCASAPRSSASTRRRGRRCPWRCGSASSTRPTLGAPADAPAC